MPIVIGIIVALIICLIAVLLVVRREKAVKLLEQNLDSINRQIVIFNSEYASILKHFIPESEENDFVAKWNELYLKVSKYHLLKRHDEYVEIKQFKETYRDLHKSIFESNAEIKRKETLRKLSGQVSAFFEELAEITNHYVTHYIETRFRVCLNFNSITC